MPIEIRTRNESDDFNDKNLLFHKDNEIISQLENVEIHSKKLNFILSKQLGILSLPKSIGDSQTEFESKRTEAAAVGPAAESSTAPESSQNVQKGRLKIGKKYLEWNYHDEILFQFLYPEITLHAIARDDAIVGSRPCIYLQLSNTSFYLNGAPFIPTDENGNELEAENDEDEEFLEMRLVPTISIRGIIDDLFAALCEASALHQDKEEDDIMDDAYEILEEQNTSNSGWITSENLSSFVPSQAQQARLDRLEELLQESTPESNLNENGKRSGPESGQFDDADDEFQR